MKRYFISVDLEGVHGVVGEPYSGLLRTISDYPVAVENATAEINSAINALFDGGADEVVVWDGHGGGGNLDFTKIDARAKKIETRGENSVYTPYRFDNVKTQNYDGVIYIGYHAREGSGGILAHTYSSVVNQYIKINGQQLGEFDIDARICGEFNAPALFVASDDVCLNQIKQTSPDTVTVLTKTAHSRNSALFRDRNEVLGEIYDGVRQALTKEIQPVKFTYPLDFEIRYTRMEHASERLASLKDVLPTLCYGEDTHVLKATIYNVDELRLFF
jgi:D-amino peptidase